MAHQHPPGGESTRFINKRSPTAVDSAIGARIRLLRRNARMTLKNLGRAIGVSSVQLQRYEAGTTRVAASRLVAITSALSVPIETLLGATREIDTATPPPAIRTDVAELLRLFSDIQDPAHRMAVISLVRSMALRLDKYPAMGGPFAPTLTGANNGSVPADKP